MTYSTLASQVDLGRGRFPPARSIPNLPNESCTMASTTSQSYILARSSSQPAEMWGRDIIVDSSLTENHCYDDSTDNVKSLKTSIGISIATQTDTKIDLPAIEKFIVQNPRLVLNILGILEPTYHIECELQPQTLIPIPEADLSSPDEATTPPDNQKRFSKASFGYSNPISTTPQWDSACNSNNQNTECCRSTDALISTSDDCLSTENLAVTQPTDSISVCIIQESDIIREAASSCSIVSSSSSSSSCISSTSSSKNPNKLSNESLLKRKHSRKDNQRDSASLKKLQQHSEINLSSSKDASCGGDQEEDNSNYDELNEKCALLCNDVRKNSFNRSSITDLQKRTLLMPRPPFGYRFSAGDADKLEKGIKQLPSTRSLKDNWIDNSLLLLSKKKKKK